jgi:putative transposase
LESKGILMKRKRHSPQQVVRKLQEAQAALSAGRELAAVCQLLGISEQTYYRWKQKYGGMKAEEAQRLALLEEENARLKKLVADLSLDKAILTEALDVAKNL